MECMFYGGYREIISQLQMQQHSNQRGKDHKVDQIIIVLELMSYDVFVGV